MWDNDSSGAHLVATAGFGSIQCFVRASEEVLSRGHARGGKGGDPHATRQMERAIFADVERMLAHAFAQPFSERRAAVGRCFRKNEHELLSAVPRDDIDRADGAREQKSVV